MLNTRWGKTLSLSFLSRFSVGNSLRLWRRGIYDRRAQRPEDLNPLRAELFSADQMEHFGRVLASEHSLSSVRTRDLLLTRLDDNEQVLLRACALLTEAIKARSRIAPAGEWLLDNFYMIEEQIRTARRHLPKNYSRELPRLASGQSAGLPRVYDLALSAISHGDGRIDAEMLSRFVAAYQTITPLTLGELWAIPIMLRLALIENLRRVSLRITTARAYLNQAREWASQMVEVAESDPKNLIIVIADMARSNPPMVSAFIAELVRRLQGHGPALALPLTWIEQRLAEESLTIEQMVHAENQQQAVDQVSISNSIGSLRFLGAYDWRVFVETMSIVEQILREDRDDGANYANAYGQMDFATRDEYRHVIDRLAKQSELAEAEVARAAILLAQQGGATGCSQHVGYYLIDDGLPQLEQRVAARVPLIVRLRRRIAGAGLSLYLGAIATLVASASLGLLSLAQGADIGPWQWGLLAVLALLATAPLASTLVNWVVTLGVLPKRLPRLDFASGIPPELATLVVVPCLLTHQRGIDDLLEALEVRFLGNRDAHIYFALLTDLGDAPHETLPGDNALLLHACEGIARLNTAYPPDARPDGEAAGAGGDYPTANRFFLFHRPRLWNPCAHCWMGHERKRGKLADLNQLLREGQGYSDAFSLIVGDIAALPKLRYVITLDTDTQLPRDAARQFVGTMAHPLNRPVYDPERHLIRRGYGILQPRMAAGLSAANRSRYVQLYGGESGIDPYTRSVSDVYQDLFGEGSFIGKGIYDLDAFEQVLGGRFPDNRILSHDLLEGCYARAGLLSDVHLYEDAPVRYSLDVSRRERWIRGDWQIARWLWPGVPGANGQQLVNPLSLLSRWKIADNLLRSLAPVALLLLLLIGWVLLPAPLAWTLVVLGFIALPPILTTALDTLRKPDEVFLRQHLAAVSVIAGRHLIQTLFRISCLPHEASYSLTAILRSLWRLWFAPARLLEWRASAELEQGAVGGLSASWRLLWSSPVIALITAAALAFLQPAALIVALPLLGLWLVAPLGAWWLGLPLMRSETSLSPQQTLFLRRIARKTWAYFERFVVAEDNWLPPDNFQENPGPVIAHRTSPTNMGLALLGNLSAYDFGFISADVLLERTANTFGSMDKLERYRGHFFNWYDTLSLQPLPPRYISAVDSGNLAGHLLTLRAGLIALPEQAIPAARVFEGLRDTLLVLSDSLQAARLQDELPAVIQDAIIRLRSLLTGACMQDYPSRTASVPGVLHCLTAVNEAAIIINTWLAAQPGITLAVSGELLSDRMGSSFADNGNLADEAKHWGQALAQQSGSARDELLFFAPWLVFRATPAALTGFMASLAPFAELNAIPTLKGLAGYSETLVPLLDEQLLRPGTPAEREWLLELRGLINAASARASERIARCVALAAQANHFAAMDYDFLYDRTRHLIAVGYNLDDYRRDNSFYDLLASEARLCNFVAIAQGQVPQESWFALGRLRTMAEGEPVLVSWSGSMFEYLMPMLVMPSYEGTLLDQTCHAAVCRQIAYGKQRGLPWGISESGYYTFDASLNYQYHAFGVPGLGFKRGLAEDAVISPYASVLALMVAPEAACENLERLASAGVEGRFGFYEAVDYTDSRLARGQTSALVQSFMVHHQGMSLLALAHLLLDRPMQRRFAADPLFQATLLLLQERIPKSSVLHTHVAEHADGAALFDQVETASYAPLEADTPTPEVQLLSNGRYQVMITNAGGGYSRWKDLAVTRWREDATRDNWGMFVYLRDATTNDFWSASHQPTLKRADHYAAMFSEGRAEFRRRDHDIETYTELVVSPEDDIELRRLRITNRSSRTRTLELTSYAEVVLALPAADATQTAFGNLFVQTEILPERRALLCTRRPRSVGEHTPWMFHLLSTNGSPVDQISYETDRLRFTGRGRTLMAPQAVTDGGELSGSQGSVLDPIVAIRCRITLEAGQVATLDLVSGTADTRDACMALVSRYQDRHLADRVFDLAATHSGVTLRQINASEADAQIYRRLASSVLYAHSALRAEASVLVQNRRGQSGLWGYAISGDLPIVLLKIATSEHIELARQLIQCHAYWRLKGLSVDLVIWNEDHIGYRQRLQDQIMGLIATGSESHAIDRPGGIFVRSGEQISHEDRILLQSVARAIIDGNKGSLAEQVSWHGLAEKKVARLMPNRKRTPEANLPQRIAPRADLILTNPLGGFTPDGREYIITTTRAQMTPLPWVNVIANPGFGTVISESGLAYTWSENAHEFRLTPWCDDPVGSAGGEAFYLRDEDTGHVWSPTPLPKPGQAPYVTRHGFGYSVFEHTDDGVCSQLWVYVDLEESVKFSVLKVTNLSARRRRLSATGYVEWVLGDLRTKSALHTVTEIDSASGALFARNAYNSEFGGRACFFDVDDNARTLTGDRTEFLGRNGSLGNPDALTRTRLSGRLGAGLDPCGAIQVPFELDEGESREIIFRLGAGQDIEQARALAQRMRHLGSARAALAKVHEYWTRTLGAVQVKTPDPAFNVLANGWLLYQTLACRLWARSGYYQSGGAYGYRDQLQDTMALAHTQPGMMRAQLLRAAQRQYHEGDVQHWWHPPQGRGVRTRCSDDYLWLPLVTCHYVQNTGDTGVLDEQLHYLTGRLLNEDEESYYDLPGQSTDTGSLYQHCQRAIEHGLRFGERGMPLMGSGDWNDGMNLVGIHGKGESVWLGFMLYKVLLAFAKIARQQQDPVFADRCLHEAKLLQQNIDQYAWDGAWFRRAWFDDGVALGSAVNDECRIDSIAQSWSVLSGAGDPMRARQAMASLDKHLVRRDQGIIQLLDPPFDKSAMNPGYIKGYVPGVRENGGQYTHAAIWATMAFAELGDSQRAWELFNIINPVNHGNSAAAVALYKAEPYVVAADVYAIAPHTGRGGWSWYTGSAGWLYRLMVESLLGITRQGNELHIKPCLPKDWPGYAVDYRFGNTLYRIEVIQRDGGEGNILLDGIVLQGAGIPLVDDERERAVKVSVAV
ncbi:cyclic beta 1-2 glucan synthetase [Cellvibrio mixtus]|uniref:Cyclic beta 1-2 glucan synthetase n=1 Tax=Cellvibrio mixtus TaxID=39650 RepID=A0A266Q9J8_9GAMM|nr:glucoamylase family protein [Cellvibrio mixtus]OZY86500.1 cyclic beta 1-2 glucan synthetase [Cellvibrio mixtus]